LTVYKRSNIFFNLNLKTYSYSFYLKLGGILLPLYSGKINIRDKNLKKNQESALTPAGGSRK
jgi:hypothetical protein